MPRLALPPHVHMTVSRGREYFAYHPFRGTNRAGKRVALPGCPMNPDGTPNATWWAAYYAAAGSAPQRPSAGTFDALIEAWKGNAELGIKPSPEWAELAGSTQSNYTHDLGVVSAAWGALPVKALEPRHVLELRDKRRDTPAATNNLIACLSSMLSWSIPRGWRSDNPCDHVRRLKGGEPYRAWPWTPIRTFEDLAVPEMWWAAALALYSGQRQGDVLTMKWSEIADGVMSVAQEKTKERLWVPIHRDLKPVLASIPRRAITVLSSRSGTPWTKDGFKSQWQHQMECIELVTGECHGLVFHGLRKSAVVFLLEAGCSTAEVSAVTGQSLQMVEHYALDVNKRKLAASAILKWESDSVAAELRSGGENGASTEFVQPPANLVQHADTKGG
jgi:integrase